MKSIVTMFFACLTALSALSGQSQYPKREFRATWIATVANIDWPTMGASSESQKASLAGLLDQLRDARMNAVMFQIRTECDALYNSKIEPWSIYLTGFQGSTPNPYYDPLQFAVDEAHKRGIELHAWFNPYRAERSAGSYTTSPDHVTKKHPEWVIQVGTYRLLDPGRKAVREYVTSVIMDVVRRYDIDGVHFDDYFYQDGISTQDSKTFAEESRGYTNIGDWRRDNVNLLVKMVNDSIKAVKPWVKFGISPRGIYRPGYPAGITGSDNYNAIYTDPVTWLYQEMIDYINPQLYWVFGGGQDYGKLMPWWAQTAAAGNRHMYVGHADYRIKEASWSSSEVPNQVRLNRRTAGCQGSVFYNTNELLVNPKGFLDSLKNDLYRYYSLPPVMNWKDLVPPNAPRNFRYGRVAGTGVAGLIWDAPAPASDGESAQKFVVYRLTQPSFAQSDYDNAKNIAGLTGQQYYLPQGSALNGLYFSVSALDRNNNESAFSQAVEVKAASMPLLAMPANNAVNQKDTTVLRWNYADNASGYTLQVASEPDFNSASMKLYKTGLTDTSYVLTILSGQSKYYWRVMATNIAGSSEFTQPSSFTTGFPVAVQLASPAHTTQDVQLSPLFSWLKTPSVVSYRFQLSSGSSMMPLLLDSAGIKDTSLLLSNLTASKIYYWRVSASNQYGTGNWSPTWGFRTTGGTAVEDEKQVVAAYSLQQNYPNPFNPSTRINYSLMQDGYVKLSVYNVLGKEVAVLADGPQTAGNHSVVFNFGNYGNEIPSGIYFYTIRSGSFVSTRKMMILK
ncbi:MAG: family 10 glycosylhydrolase [Syntrophothermus sp.]